jgi:hypothetical protein
MSSGRIALFLLSLFAVLGAANAYGFRRAAAVFRLERRGRRALVAVLAASAAVLVVSRLASGIIPDAVLRPAALLGIDVELAILFAVPLLGFADLALAAAGLLRARRAESALAPPPPPPAPISASPAQADPEDASRRRFVAQAAVGSAFVVAGGGSFYGGLFGRHDYRLEEIEVRIPGLPRRLDGFTLVQVSDIHLGLFVGEPEMRSAEALVRRARADLVVLTGDLVDHDPRYLPTLGELTRRLAACARGGLAAIPGNHDYYTGIGPTLETLARAGARVLRNDGFVVGDAGGAFALLGVDDVWGARVDPSGGPDLQRALAAVPADLPRVLLCHNPLYFPEAAPSVALQLSGHTHGGQINPGINPASLVLPHGYVAGMYQRGESRLYVNRGFGTAGPPARIGAPPEVTRVVLVSG